MFPRGRATAVGTERISTEIPRAHADVFGIEPYQLLHCHPAMPRCQCAYIGLAADIRQKQLVFTQSVLKALRRVVGKDVDLLARRLARVVALAPQVNYSDRKSR